MHYDHQYFLDRDHLELHIAKSLQIFCQNHKLKKILDVGCGSGRLVNWLNQQGFTAWGCDIQSEAIKMARKINPRNKIIKASATKLPFKNHSFDLVTCISVIEHLTAKQAQKFLIQARNKLKPGGYIFLITPNYNSPLRWFLGKNWFGYKDPTHLHFFTPNSLAKLLKSTGFSHIQFRFKPIYNLDFDWHIPSFLKNFPRPVKNFLNYLMISSFLSTWRDSFWIAAKK